ncbi:MAG: alpha/beta hydrolase [Planctomycetes bacterium]|nr:alpha/beta hydrolase [Planctomycetota bacterium]
MITFAHGLEGSPSGSKVKALREAGFDVAAPDFRGLALAARIARLEESTRGGGMVLAGSRLGGLTAAIVASRHPERFKGLLLCAPAFNFLPAEFGPVESLLVPPSLRTLVIHGRNDDLVPVEVSRAFRDRCGPHVTLRESEDGHRLSASIPRIVEAARELGA